MKNRTIEEIILLSFSENLELEDQKKLELWSASSEENRQIYFECQKVWESVEWFNNMNKYKPDKAIRQVKTKIKSREKSRLFSSLQKIAALFLLLATLASVLIFLNDKPAEEENMIAWHTLETQAGVRSEFILPDSTKVFLHPKTTLRYPIAFSDTLREVILTGAAYFEVQKNRKAPFIVRTGRLNIEVTGTEFVAINFPEEKLMEVILVTGGVSLYTGIHPALKENVAQLTPGEKAIWDSDKSHLEIVHVDIQKYEAWRDGILLFRDDPLPEVVTRLNRWFNVNIKLEEPELENWVYTATFENETLEQALELLKMSAPIEYTIEKREMNTDKTFSKMDITIKLQSR